VLRGMLQVSVHQDDSVPVRLVQGRTDRGLFAEIAREANADQAFVAPAGFGDDRPGLVARSVVDQQNLEVAAGRLKDRQDRLQGQRDLFLLVIERDQER